MIDPGDTGIHDALALFLSLGSTFTSGAVRDLDAIAAWPVERLCRTALAPLIGLPHDAEIDPVPPINAGSLNMEQIEATAQAMCAPLSVVTGPPGTGKSQAIVAIATTALWAGQTVIVASKNHQALDAVEQRLSSIAPGASFLVRTLDPARDVDRSMADVLNELVLEPAARGVADPESDVAAELDRRAKARATAVERITKERRLRLQLAEDLERLESRQLADLPGTAASVAGPSASGFWRLLLRWFGFARGEEAPNVDDGTIPTAALRQRIDDARARLAELGPIENPVTLTQEIASLARHILARRVNALSVPDENTRLALSNAHDDLQLQGEIALGRRLAELVLLHRPALARLGPRRTKADPSRRRAVRTGDLRRSEPMRHWLGTAATRPGASRCHRRRRSATRLHPAARHRSGPKPDVGAAATPDGDGAVRAKPQEHVRSRSLHSGRADRAAARPIPLGRRYCCLHQPGFLWRQASGRCRPRRIARTNDRTSRPPLDARPARG